MTEESRRIVAISGFGSGGRSPETIHPVRTGFDRHGPRRLRPTPGGRRDSKPRRKASGFALLIAPDIAPEDIDGVRCARLVFGSPLGGRGSFDGYLLWLPVAAYQHYTSRELDPQLQLVE